MATISSTLAVVLLCAASLVATGGAAGGHHLEANKQGYDLVAQTCATVSRRHYRGPGLTRQFCESVLRSDRRTMAARDPRDLALVAMDLVQSSATYAENKIGSAVRPGAYAKWGKPTLLRLHYCQQDYNDVESTGRECRALVHEYNPRAGGRPGQRYGNGNLSPSEYLECTGRLVHAADDCWVHMLNQDYGAKAWVWKDIVEVSSRANLVKAMVEQMVGVVDRNDR